MKTRQTLLTAGAITAFSLGLAFGPPAHGEQQPQDRPGEQPRAQPGQRAEEQSQQRRMETQQQQLQDQTLRASDLQGSRVVNQAGDRLGTLDDLVIEPEEGVLSYAIVAAGGFLGIGADWRPVPPEAFQVREVALGHELVLDITEDQWEQAPTIEREQIDQLAQETRGQQIYEFYGEDWQARQQRTQEFAAPGRERQQTQQTEQPADQQTQQIQQQLEQAMTQAGAEREQAQQEAQRLAQKFSREQPDQDEIEKELEQALQQAGVDQDRAEQEAQRLSRQVHQQIEFAAPGQQRQQPGQQTGQTQQIQQQLEQAMTQAGAERQQAQQEAQRLAQKFSREQPDQDEIEKELEQALQQAGVDQDRAEQEAQRLSQRVHQQIASASPQRQQQQAQMQRRQQQEQQQFGQQTQQQQGQQQQVQLASDIMELNLFNQEQQEIGQLSDLLVNLDEGRVPFAIFNEGTGLFPGEEEFAVATKALELRDDRAILNITQQDLQQAQVLTAQELQQQSQEAARMDAQQARQQPQVFRYQDVNGAPGVYGAPEQRERQQREPGAAETEEPELEQPQRQPPPPHEQEPAQPGQQPRY